MKDLLFLVHRIPYPPNKGDKIRSYHMLKFLAREFRVHVAAFIDDPNDWQYVTDVQALCGETCFRELNPTAARIRSARGLLTGDPLTLPYYANGEMQRWVDDLVQRKSIQHVVAFSSSMAQYAQRYTSLRRVIDFVDVDSDKWAQYAPTKSWPMNWVYARESRALLSYERKVAATWNASVFVSKDEAALFQRLAPECAARVSYFYNGVDSEYFSPDRDYANPYSGSDPVLVFTGAMDYWANVDAVVWFVEHVFPRIRAARPQARFYIVGSRPTPQVQVLGTLPGVTVTGAVPDVRPYVIHAHAAVAPLRIARGIQNKVLEAMALAKPVIVTPQAAEGLLAGTGTELTVTDDPQTMARVALTALENKVRAEGARAYVVANYQWDVTLQRLRDLLLRDAPESTR